MRRYILKYCRVLAQPHWSWRRWSPTPSCPAARSPRTSMRPPQRRRRRTWATRQTPLRPPTTPTPSWSPSSGSTPPLPPTPLQACPPQVDPQVHQHPQGHPLYALPVHNSRNQRAEHPSRQRQSWEFQNGQPWPLQPGTVAGRCMLGLKKGFANLLGFGQWPCKHPADSTMRRAVVTAQQVGRHGCATLLC